MAAKIKFSSTASEDILFALADVIRTALGFSERNENMVRSSTWLALTIHI